MNTLVVNRLINNDRFLYTNCLIFSAFAIKTGDVIETFTKSQTCMFSFKTPSINRNLLILNDEQKNGFTTWFLCYV